MHKNGSNVLFSQTLRLIEMVCDKSKDSTHAKNKEEYE